MPDPKGPLPDRSSAVIKAATTETLNPGLSLDRIGQALASFYDDLVAEGVPEHLAALVRQVQTEPSTAPKSPRKSGRIAVVVEDDAATRALAEALLEETELGVMGCDTAEAALSLMRTRGGDVALIFADVGLAGDMDGLQLAGAVALLWPGTRVVVTSGRRTGRPESLVPQAVFIPKPWRPFDLLVEAERATSETQLVLP